MFFDTPAKGVVDVAVTLTAACLFDAYFAQAVFSIVVVVLGCADGLFAVFFAYQSVEVVVLVAAFDEDIRQGGSDAIAQWVVLIGGGVGGIFADNTAIGIIAKVKPTRD